METASRLCPDPEGLAAFLDQGLGADESARIEAHLAGCDRCRVIAARVLDSQSAVQEAGPAPRPVGTEASARRSAFSRAHVVWGAGSLLAAAAVLAVIFNVGTGSKLADLAAAVGDERPVEARLTGGFRYGPLRAPVRSGGSSAASDDWTLYAAAGRIREDADRDPSAPNLHALGVAYLVLGQYDEAVRALEDAIAEDAEQPRYHSDLAAAYLARARQLDRPDDLARALGAAERAIKGSDTLLEARFNRALALEALFLTDQARQAWEDYLARDGSSGWASDARTHLQKLQQNAAPQDRARNNSPPPITDTSVEAGLDWLLREGLPLWAEAVLANDSARSAADSSFLISYARKIADKSGDRFPISLAGLTQPGAASRTRAAEIREFAQARVALRSDDSNLESATLAACVNVDGILAPLCHLDLGRLDVLRRRDESLRVRVAALERLSAGSAYLAGRLDLLNGYRGIFGGDYTTTLEHYERAFQRFSDAKYLSLAGITAAQIGEVFELLGFSDQAWQWRYRSLQISSLIDDPNLKYLSHVSTAESLARFRNMPAAAAFVAALDGRTVDGVTGLSRALLEMSRSKIALALGDRQFARESLARADEFVARSTDFRAERLRADLLILKADIERRDALLERARTTLEKAVDTMGPERVPHRVTALLSHANISAQRAEWHSSSQQSIAEALRLMRGRAAYATSQPVRREDILPAFETAATLITSEPALQSVRGLQLFEQLREVLEGAPAGYDLSHLADFERALEAATADTLFVVFSFTDTSMVSWTVSGGIVEFKERAVSPAAVTALANTLTIQINRNPEREDLWRTTLAQLYELVFGGLASLRTARELVVVPDGPLHRVPFGSLFDRGAGQYLFERMAVRVAPNIAFALGDASLSRDQLSALVIGDPEFRGPQASLFPRLMDARLEAVEVSKLYAAPTVMLGSDATKPRVLASIRSADVVHFAGHALASPSLSSPRLLLAGDPRDSSSTISAADLTGRVKPGARVILAACETGATTLDRTTSLTSISSAFLRAGAGSVVATLWPVDDVSGASFFPSIHRELLSGMRAATAVARAQRACRHDQTCRRSASTWIGTTAYGYK